MEKQKKSHFPFRLNIIFFSIFILFSALILRLGFVQIVYGENFKRDLARNGDITIQNPVPRGKFLDRNKRIIVDNVPKKAITYTNLGATQQEMLSTAEKLAKLIVKKSDKVTEKDKKDFWILKHPQAIEARITRKEKALIASNKLLDKDLYKIKLARVTDADLQKLTPNDLNVIAIYREISNAYKFTPQIVKNEDVTDKEFAIVSENLQSLPGIDTTTDWDRLYNFQNTLKSVLGKVTTSDEGIPADQLYYFLSRGYNRNDRVGKSYLEYQYEDILHGYKAKIKNITDNSGNIVNTEVLSDGKRGKDLILSIDMDLQMKVEKIIEQELWSLKRKPGTHFLDRAYVVLMDPKTGEVLTMAGKRIIKNEKTGRTEMIDDALGTFTTTYNVGSAVKGATIITGYKTGAITPNTYLSDVGIKIKSTPLKKSWMYLGNLNEIDALKKSSNVYMFRTAIRIGEGHYAYDQPLNLKPKSFDIIRNSFAGFGLGARTGIDLPNEQIGLKGSSKLPGFLLDLVIGQYDTYSPMQMAQYVSTIANGGFRMQPHLVKEIRDPGDGLEEIGPVYQEIHPKVLNTIDVKPEWLRRVKIGFRKVFQEPGGTAYKYFRGVPYSPAGKTGTAEAFYDGPNRYLYGKEPPPVINLSLVSYAPSSNPKIAMAVLVPWAYQGKSENKANFRIGRRVMDTFFHYEKKKVDAP